MKNRRHRLWIGLNTGTALLLAAVIVLMINYLSYRHYTRTDWSRTQRYSLSPKTTDLLASLDKTVDITVFFQPGNVLYEDIHNLLREYQFHSSKLNIQWIDPDRDIALTEEMAVKYQVTEPNVVVFSTGDRNKYVRADEIAQTDASSGVERILAFLGEQAFSSAILGVIQQTAPVVYFLTGHGERDIDNFDKRTGFSGIRQLIERDNAEVHTLELSVEKQIPTDCAALIVAGASQRMSDTEAELIVTNGIILPGSLTSADDTVYTVQITPTGQGTITLRVPPDVATKVPSGTPNTGSNTGRIVYDTVAPTVAVTPDGTTTNSSPIIFTLTFSEPVTELTEGELTVGNGAVVAGSLSTTDDRVYTVSVTAASLLFVIIPSPESEASVWLTPFRSSTARFSMLSAVAGGRMFSSEKRS